MTWQQELNSQQKKAAGFSDGPVLIVAGPGTGKTKTLISRIIFLIKKLQAPPKNILALTFTKKAAVEMSERLSLALPDLSIPPFIGTFHALGFEILSKNDKPIIQIISPEKRIEVIKKIHQSIPHDSLYAIWKIKDFELAVSNYKNQLSPTIDYFSKLVDLYNFELKQLGMLDYDDLILQTYFLFKNNHQILKNYQEKFQYILVDEFQDTSPLQYKIVKLLAGEKKNIFAIGDPRQAIYSFRGATDQAFIDFKNDFPAAKEITLDDNYRSIQSIVDLASGLFPITKKLASQTKFAHQELIYLNTLSEYTEADWILKKIASLMGGLNLSDISAALDEHVRFSDIAIIYRTHNLARVLKQKFKDSAIPHQSVGDESMYEQKEIKFLINCLRFLSNKASITTELSEAEKISLSEIDSRFWENDNENNIRMNLSDLAKKISNTFKIEDRLKSQNYKLLELYEFLNSLITFDNNPIGLSQFIEYMDNLKANEYYDTTADKVTLLTMHAAKGLEFKYVFVLGFEDGLIPFVKDNQETNFEEEKRLLYVAITRAKQGIYLISAKTRNRKASVASRFRNLLDSSILPTVVDDAIARIEKKFEEKKRQEQQMKLF